MTRFVWKANRVMQIHPVCPPKKLLFFSPPRPALLARQRIAPLRASNRSQIAPSTTWAATDLRKKHVDADGGSSDSVLS